MRVIEVIPARRWRNIKTGMSASLYGAVPWTSNAAKDDWQIEESGWTWRNANGTIGLGRAPAATRQEALDVMARVNALGGK